MEVRGSLADTGVVEEGISLVWVVLVQRKSSHRR